MRRFYLSLLLLLSGSFLFSQSKVSDDYIAWSSTRKLTANDFTIKSKDLQTNTSLDINTPSGKIVLTRN